MAGSSMGARVFDDPQWALGGLKGRTPTYALRVALPCAGIDGAGRALMELKVPFAPRLVVDSNQHVWATLKHLHQGYENHVRCGVNLLDLDVGTLSDCECLITAAPCPQWSTMGVGEGERDFRDLVFKRITQWITNLAGRSLKFFVLESVMGISRRSRARRCADSYLTKVVGNLRENLKDLMPCVFTTCLQQLLTPRIS